MKTMRIAFIGAGGVNFGSPEGPWNHAKRLVTLEGPEVVGIADPAPGLAGKRMKEWSAHPHFAHAQAFQGWRAMLDSVKPQAVIIGVPPAFHGGGSPGTGIERACAERGIAIFVEKPLSCLPLPEVEATAEVVRRSGVISSVGYMIRYTKVVEFAKKALAKAGVKPRHIILRYACAYSEIRRRDWWDTAKSGGPIIEQATHFADIARYLGGEVDLGTVSALALGPDLELTEAPVAPDGKPAEEGVPLERRIPRTTSASWAFTDGCLGTLTHGILLHRVRYETDIDIWADGLHIHIADPYHEMKVRVRAQHSEDYQLSNFKGDDPYFTELDIFFRAVATGNRSEIKSPYEDAVKSYALTWAITEQARARQVPASGRV